MDSPSSGVRISFDGEGLRLDTSDDAEIICQKMLGIEVEILILQGNTFGIEAAERVGQSLATQSSLREAHFKDLFTSRGREEVPEALKHLLQGITNSGAQLTLLDLSDNAIGPIGAPAVIEFLESPAADTLEKLYVNNCGWGPEGSTSLATTISKLKNLREFICGRSRLENKGATNMSRALSELEHLEVLKLNQNGIGVTGIKQLVKVLEANQDTIMQLDLSDNTILPDGCDALAHAISQAKNLKSLRLDDALLENAGFSIICDALSKSTSLENLEEATFEGNELHGPKIVDLIRITFANCQEGFTLNLLENEFSPDELARLQAFAEESNLDILIDDIESEDEDNDDDTSSENNGCKDLEEGEIEDDESDVSNGYVDLGNNESEMREVSQDFIETIRSKPFEEELRNSAFLQLVSTGDRPDSSEYQYKALQVLCEELGLMKYEATGKKKQIERDAIIYIGRRLHELPEAFRNFFELELKNNTELSNLKFLFEKL